MELEIETVGRAGLSVTLLWRFLNTLQVQDLSDASQLPHKEEGEEEKSNDLGRDEARREQASQDTSGGGWRVVVEGSPLQVAGPPLPAATLAGEIDVRVSQLSGLKGGMDGAWGRGSGM